MKRTASLLLSFLLLLSNSACADGRASAASETPPKTDAAAWEATFLASAEERKQRILTNSETMPCAGGMTYYLSNTGDDDNDGLTPDTA